MRITITVVFLTACLVFFSPHLNANDYGLQFANSQVDCSGATPTFCTDIQIQSTDGTNFLIGSHTIYLTFNKDALEFKHYTPISFFNYDPAGNCQSSTTLTAADSYKCPAAPPIPEETDPWDYTCWSADEPATEGGQFNITTILSNYLGGGTNCPGIGADWITFGTLCFDVEDANASSGLLVEYGSGKTEINIGIPDGPDLHNPTVASPTLDMALECPPDCEAIVSGVSGSQDVCDGANPDFDAAIAGVDFGGGVAADFTFEWYLDAALTQLYDETGLTHSGGDACASEQVTLYANAVCTATGIGTAAGELTVNVYPLPPEPVVVIENNCVTTFTGGCEGDQLDQSVFENTASIAVPVDITVTSAVSCVMVHQMTLNPCTDCHKYKADDANPIPSAACDGDLISTAIIKTEDGASGEVDAFQWEVDIDGAGFVSISGETGKTLSNYAVNNSTCAVINYSFRVKMTCNNVDSYLDAGTVGVYPQPAAPSDQTYDETTCTTSFTFDCDLNSADAYVANPGDAAQTVQIMVTNAGGCMANFNQDIQACPASDACPNFDLDGDEQLGAVCAGETVSVGITVTGGTLPYTVQWTVNDVDLDGATTDNADIILNNPNCNAIQATVKAVITCDGNETTIQAGTWDVYPVPALAAGDVDNDNCLYTFTTVCPGDVVDPVFRYNGCQYGNNGYG